MARDRKSRHPRRTRQGAPLGPPRGPVRGNVPGSIEHSSGDADEFDAALVRGANGVPAEPASDEVSEAEDGGPVEGPAEEPEPSAAEPAPAPSLTPGDGRDEEQPAELDRISRRAAGVRRAPEPRGGNRALAFLRASWAELHRVQWPDRRQVAQATAVVLGFVVVAGAYLGLADVVAKAIVEAIL